MTLANVRKAGVAVATLLTQALALGVLTGDVRAAALLVLGALGAYGVYAVPNQAA